MKSIRSLLFITALTLSLTACSTFFDKDNTPAPTPLTSFKPALTAKADWMTRTGPGAKNEYLKLTPAISDNQIFTSSNDGTVTALDKETGKKIWSVGLKNSITTGVALNENLLFIGTDRGELLALNKTNGNLVWHTRTSSEMLASAASADGIVLVKTVDGNLSAFKTTDGHLLWHYQQTEPTLILRGASVPQITNGTTVVGFENGALVKLSLQDGRPIWQSTIAQPTGSFAIQRMIDIDADPLIMGGRVYTATYQGQLAALELSTGRVLWTHDFSSDSGLASDGKALYATDVQGNVWAFDVDTGSVYWRQSQLLARGLTAPVLFANAVVVGDAEGYLHWLDKADGHFIGRAFTNKSGLLASPLADQNDLYIYTKDGHLGAYSIR